MNAIWDELKVYFDKYDQGKKTFLNEAELRAFVIEVLNETTERELNYVFWNLFRVDSNSNKEVDFPEFAPFILNHAGEIALQRFHKEQPKGKSTLTEDEVYVVLSNAYKFLSSMPKQRSATGKIFARISKDGAVSYGGFLSWIHHALAAKYVKK